VRDPKKKKPEKMSDVLASFMASTKDGTRVDQARIVPEWPTLVGPQISAVTEPIMITRDGTLFVAVKTSSWMSELSLMEPQLLFAINANRATGKVAKIHWRLMG
jgi:predicted nucleic acid-binding Zn ribbon protein